MKRRKFLSNSGLLLGGLSLAPIAACADADTKESTSSKGKSAAGAISGPIVLSTWYHGLAANQGAGMNIAQG